MMKERILHNLVSNGFSLPKAATRYLFFTGKGGVGKTSLSCAMGLSLAASGKRVLIVSTDPASNLDEILGTRLGSRPTAVEGAPGLLAMNIDPELAAAEYRERLVGPHRGILPAAAIASMEEQFSGACTMELAAFDEFARLLGDPSATAEFDHVIFDTAPTGHTLRLLTLPSAWSEFIASSTGGTALGPLAGLEKQRALYAATVTQLSDASLTTVVLVSRPDHSALREAERTRLELADLGLRNLHLALNGVFVSNANGDGIARALIQWTQEAINTMPEGLAVLPRTVTPFLPKGTVGIETLRTMSLAPTVEAPNGSGPAASHTLPPRLAPIVNDIEAMGHGVIMTMGKGGVGKTTIAAAIALELARRGHRVTLSTTDPAAHLSSTVTEAIPSLTVTSIDPEREVTAYRQEVTDKASGALDDAGRAMLQEDLKAPCNEEIAVFRAFANTVAAGQNDFVVIDTAPTGHTILLLDAAEAYHREVLRTQADMPLEVRQLLPRLRDPKFTRILIVTQPEATPVHEAERLQRDLLRAGITPYAWIINQSLLASGTKHTVLTERGNYEVRFIEEVVGSLSTRCALVPWLATPPVGATGLAAVVR